MKLGEWINKASNAFRKIKGDKYTIVEDGVTKVVKTVGKHKLRPGEVINDGALDYDSYKIPVNAVVTGHYNALGQPVVRRENAVLGQPLRPGEVVKVLK